MRNLKPEERAALQLKLDEANEAYHQLQLGNQTHSISAPGGRTMAVTPSNANQLNAYIFSLECQLGLRSRRPSRLFFR